MIGMTSVTFRNKSVDEVIAICKEAGIDAIEWGSDVHVPVGDVALATEVYDKTVKAGLEVSSYGSYYWLGDQSVEDFDAVLDSAVALHAKYIRVWAGHKGSATTTKEEVDAYVDQLKAISAKAETKGIIVASEMHNNTYNDTLATQKELLERVDSPAYKTYWQTISYDKVDLERLIALKDDIVNVHTFAWNKYGKRYALKKHKKAWMSYIDAYGKDGLYTLEFVKRDSDKAFLKDVATLKMLLAK